MIDRYHDKRNSRDWPTDMNKNQNVKNWNTVTVVASTKRIQHCRYHCCCIRISSSSSSSIVLRQVVVVVFMTILVFLCKHEQVVSFVSTNNNMRTNMIDYTRITTRKRLYAKKHIQYTTSTTKLCLSLPQQVSTTSSLVIPLVEKFITTQPIQTTILLTILHILGGITGTPIVAKAINTWYNQITLPKWTPPNRIFPIMWTLLYGCMGTSISRILIKSTTTSASVAQPILLYVLWMVHYSLNLLWAPIFFGKQKLRFGLGINYMLLFTLAFGIIRPFYAIDKMASIILIPYLIWLMFATVLNETICQLNPTSKGYNNAKFYYDLNKLQVLAKQYAFSLDQK